MDKKNNHQTWVGNMFQRIEAVYHEVDEFVNKDTVKYVENHVQTVGESVKRFYSGIAQDFLLPPLVEPVQHVPEIIPTKPIKLVETNTSPVVEIKESTLDCNTNKSEEGPLVPTEKCQELPVTGVCHSEQISSEISGYPIDDTDSNSYVQDEDHNPIKTLDKTFQVHLNSSISIQENFVVEQFLCTEAISPEHKNSSEAFMYSECADENRDDDYSAKISHESSSNHFDDRSSQDRPEAADWGIEDIFNLDLVIDKVIDGEPPMFPSEDVNISRDKILFTVPFVEENHEKVPIETFVSGFETSCPQEKETLLNRSIDESKSDLNTTSIHPSSKLESSVTCNENKEERKPYDSSSSSFRKSLRDPDMSNSNSTESAGCFSSSSRNLSSCESLGGLVRDNINDSTTLASSSCSLSEETTRTNDAVSGTELCGSEQGCYDSIPIFDSSFSSSENGMEAGSSMVDDEYFNMDTIDLSDKKQHMDTIDLSNKKQLADGCVIVEGQNLFSYPYSLGRSKSYKKILQDAFMSRKRLTQEYKQLAIWYGDIDQEFSQLTKKNTTPNIGSIPKSTAQDLPDSEWELL